MSYLSSDLVTSIKRRANIPTSQNTFQNSDFYSLIDEELRSKLLPLVLKNREEFYVRPLDYPIVANQAGYLIPTRAIAAALRDVMIVNANNDLARTPLDRLSPEDLYAPYTGNVQAVIQKSGFYLEGNKVVIYPTPTAGGNLLRLTYHCRPNSVVDTAACGLVTAINTAAKTITVASLPSTFTTSTPLDFVKANPHFECSAIDQTPSAINGTTLTFTTALPTDLAVGDYICLAGQSCVIQVPAELHPLLTQYVVVRVLSAQSDQQALSDAVKELEKLEANAQLLIAPRVAGKAKRVTNSRGINRFV